MTDREVPSDLSPGSFLARVFIAPEGAREQIILSGPRGSGKTTWCQALAHAARQQGIPVCGLVSPTGVREGRRAWIDLLDLQHGDQVRLAERRAELPPGEDAPDEGPPPCGTVTRNWAFEPHGLAWGNARLSALFSTPLHDSLFIIDELGPLEFECGQGLINALDLFTTRWARLSLAVIRPELVPKAQQRWPTAQVITLPGRGPFSPPGIDQEGAM